MATIGGEIPDQMEEFIRQRMEVDDRSMSEVIEFCVRYTAEHKYREEL